MWEPLLQSRPTGTTGTDCDGGAGRGSADRVPTCGAQGVVPANGFAHLRSPDGGSDQRTLWDAGWQAAAGAPTRAGSCSRALPTAGVAFEPSRPESRTRNTWKPPSPATPEQSPWPTEQSQWPWLARELGERVGLSEDHKTKSLAGKSANSGVHSYVALEPVGPESHIRNTWEAAGSWGLIYSPAPCRAQLSAPRDQVASREHPESCTARSTSRVPPAEQIHCPGSVRETGAWVGLSRDHRETCRS